MATLTMTGKTLAIAEVPSDEVLTISVDRGLRYSLKHDGVDSNGDAAEATIYVALKCDPITLVADHTPELGKFALGVGEVLTLASGNTEIRLKAASGTPCVSIVAGI